MTKFYSKYSQLSVVVGNKKIKFANHVYVTDNKAEIEVLKKLSSVESFEAHVKRVASTEGAVTMEDHESVKAEVAKLKAELAEAKKK